MNKIELLANTTLFAKLKPQEIDLIASVLEEISLKKGDFVYKQGDIGDSFYIVAEGETELVLRHEDGMVGVVGRLGKGEHFGELSLLTGTPRSLSVKAASDLTLLTLDKLVFDDILLENPRIHRLLDQVMAERLRRASRAQVGAISSDHDETKKDLSRRERELKFLGKLNTLVHSDFSYKEIQQKVADMIFQEFDPDLCEIYSVEDDSLLLAAQKGDPRLWQQPVSLKFEENTIVSAVASQKKAIAVFDTDPASYEDKNTDIYREYHSVLALPLISDDSLVGVLVLRGLQAGDFSEEDLKSYDFFTSHIARIFKSVRFYQDSRRRRDELIALSRIGTELNASFDLPKLLYKIVSLTASLMNVKEVVLRLMDETESVLRIKSYYGISDDVARNVTQEIGEGIAGWVIREGKAVIANDASGDPRFARNIPGDVRSVLCVPLLMKGNVIGTMSVYDKTESALCRDFVEDDLRLLSTVASQASIAIENARIFSSETTARSATKDELIKEIGDFEGESKAAKDIRAGILRYGSNLRPVLMGGESGTGRRLAAKQIHLASPQHNGPYTEVDVRQFDPRLWGAELFGHEKNAFSFSGVKRLGLLEQFRGGTVVLFHIEALEKSVQLKLLEALTSRSFCRVRGKEKVLLSVRLLFICDGDLSVLSAEGGFNQALCQLLEDQSFLIPPLRKHKRDIPRLVERYLERFNKENFKNILRLAPDALGLLMNYDWPGNLTELSNVVQRAVVLAEKDEILSEQILLGLPRTEGKFEYNLLRFPKVRSFFESPAFPILPKAIVSLLFFLGALALFMGPLTPAKNIGITLSWVYGWPVLFFSFLFAARIWCSVCALSMPGMLIQKIIKPKRKAPRFLTRYSGWIMAVLCILVLWIEIVWDAYQNPRLTGVIILAITSGSFLMSILYERDTWCRYVCPLGAMNAIFSMGSLLELRSNRHLCTNRCRNHACYKGTGKFAGCPMSRHPFTVDNNRDCTLCGNCIKNCEHQSIQLNVRLAPEELWTISKPRLADSFLIMALGAIFFIFALHREFIVIIDQWAKAGNWGAFATPGVIGSVVYFGLIAFLFGVYSFLCWIQSRRGGGEFFSNISSMAYGFIPLFLGGYMAVYLEMFVSEAWLVIPNLLALVGIEMVHPGWRLLTPGGTATLQSIIVLVGLGATLYSVYRIIAKISVSDLKKRGLYLAPFVFIIIMGILFLKVV